MYLLYQFDTVVGDVLGNLTYILIKLFKTLYTGILKKKFLTLWSKKGVKTPSIESKIILMKALFDWGHLAYKGFFIYKLEI